MKEECRNHGIPLGEECRQCDEWDTCHGEYDKGPEIFKVPEPYHVSYEEATFTADEMFSCFCRMVEDSGCPEYEARMLNSTPIFLFDKAKASKAMMYNRELAEMETELHLPFESFIMADPLGVVFLDGMIVQRTDWENSISEAQVIMLSNMLHDTFHKNEKDPNFDPRSWRSSVKLVLPSVFNTLDANLGKVSKADEAFVGMANAFLGGVHSKKEHQMMHFGLVAICQDKRHKPYGWLGIPATHHVTIRQEDGKVYDVPDREAMGSQAMVGDFLTNVMTAIGQARYIMQPKLTLILDTPRKPRDPATSKRPIRAFERSIVRFLDPEELRVVYEGSRPPQTTHASPVPHTRMAHPRTFRHERYKRMKGKTIFIHEIHVKAGDSWTSSTGRIYKVMEVDHAEGEDDNVKHPAGPDVPPVPSGTDLPKAPGTRGNAPSDDTGTGGVERDKGKDEGTIPQ